MGHLAFKSSRALPPTGKAGKMGTRRWGVKLKEFTDIPLPLNFALLVTVLFNFCFKALSSTLPSRPCHPQQAAPHPWHPPPPPPITQVSTHTHTRFANQVRMAGTLGSWPGGSQCQSRNDADTGILTRCCPSWTWSRRSARHWISRCHWHWWLAQRRSQTLRGMD